MNLFFLSSQVAKRGYAQAFLAFLVAASLGIARPCSTIQSMYAEDSARPRHSADKPDDDQRRNQEIAGATSVVEAEIAKPREGIRFTISVNKHSEAEQRPLMLDFMLENRSEKRTRIQLVLGGATDSYHVVDRASRKPAVLTEAGHRRIRAGFFSFYGGSMNPKTKMIELNDLTGQYELEPGHEYLIAVTRGLRFRDNSLSGPVTSNVLSIKVPPPGDHPSRAPTDANRDESRDKEMSAATRVVKDEIGKPRKGVRFTISSNTGVANDGKPLALVCTFENLGDTRRYFSFAKDEATAAYYVIHRASGKPAALRDAGRAPEKLAVPDFYGYSMGPKTSTTDLVDLSDYYDLEPGEEYLVAATRVLTILDHPRPECVTSNVLSIKVQQKQAGAVCP
ncbi:MAG TPA: hypothetical protein VFW87_11965 [Pirellulales bacterium]|nr:hypothetical protein [Pirellulales bacterium]